MNIALDYDNTYTADPVLWNMFLNNCILRGHKVYIITMRYENEVPQSIKDEHKIVRVIATGRKAKEKFVNNLNIKIDIWIDDAPYFIYYDAI